MKQLDFYCNHKTGNKTNFRHWGKRTQNTERQVSALEGLQGGAMKRQRGQAGIK